MRCIFISLIIFIVNTTFRSIGCRSRIIDRQISIIFVYLSTKYFALGSNLLVNDPLQTNELIVSIPCHLNEGPPQAVNEMCKAQDRTGQDRTVVVSPATT